MLFKVSVFGFNETLFAGDITAVEHVYGPSHGREIRVRGYDLLNRLQKKQSVLTHKQVTLLDLVQQAVEDLGVGVDATETGPQWHNLIQYQKSDLDFLIELSGQAGLYFTLQEDVLHLLNLEGQGTPLDLALGETLLEARIELNVAASCDLVRTIGWNPSTVNIHEGQASRARSGGSSGPDVNARRVGESNEFDLLSESLQGDSHAEAISQAELDRRTASEVILWGVAEGDPRLRPSARVNISGVDQSIAGRYVLTSVSHLINAEQGFVSELSSAPPPSIHRPRGTATAPGIVTSVNDPEGLGRVQVSLPTYAETGVEPEWMQVVSAGGGKGKGLVALPDVGDQVLVLLPQEDPSLGIVLGGLYGSGGLPGEVVVDANGVSGYLLRTHDGQRVLLDDTSRTVRVENSDGSFIEITPDRVLVHAKADLVIEAPGRSVKIRGQTIDFERA
jgi:phage protein D/phage baseplate assembly protein gpV